MRCIVAKRLAALVLGCALSAPNLIAGPAVAAAPTTCARPAGDYRQGLPWPQRQLDWSRVWPTTTGTGQTVAVLGTGVDAANAQFAPGQVLSQIDVLDDGSPGQDCDGRGTAAAGIVGARAIAASSFVGVAPGVRLLPIRYTQTHGDQGSTAPDPGRLAAAIQAATAAKASILLVVVPATVDTAALRAATAAAVAAGELVISPAAAAQAGDRTYPTAYPGVLGVGGEDKSGAATQTEQGSWVQLSAPAKDLVSTAAGANGGGTDQVPGNAYPLSDTAYAAAYTAGAAALVRSADPELSAAQTVDRLLATADRGPSGVRDDRLGWGGLDPVAAVTAVLPPGAGPSVSTAAPSGRVVPLAAPSRPAAPDRVPALLAVAGLAVAALVIALGAAVRAARRRGAQAPMQGVEPPSTTSAPGTEPTMMPRV